MRYDLNILLACAINDVYEYFLSRHRLNYVLIRDYKINVLLIRPKRARFVKMPSIVFRLACLISTGQTRYLHMTNT